MNGNDFRSLLSTFQIASGSSNNDNNNNSNNVERNKKNDSSSSRGNPDSGNARKTSNGDNDDDDDNDDNERRDDSRGLEGGEIVDLSIDTSVATELPRQISQVWNVTRLRRDLARGAPKAAEEGGALHIAICCCIVDAFPHEAIWREWMSSSLQEAEEEEVEVTADLYIHAKNPENITSSWLRSKTLRSTYRPHWNDVRIVRAMLHLTRAALQNPRTSHVVFATESCLPIASLSQTARQIRSTGAGTSFVPCYGGDSPQKTRFDEQSCWNVLIHGGVVPAEAIHKALPGWITLCRTDAQAILDLPNALWTAFTNVWAPEEVYFPTALALVGRLGEEVPRVPLTHAQWPPHSQEEALPSYAIGPEPSSSNTHRAHPLEFVLTRELIQDLHDKGGCTFARKFKQAVDLNLWKRLVLKDKRSNVEESDVCHGKTSGSGGDATRRHRHGEPSYQRYSGGNSQQVERGGWNRRGGGGRRQYRHNRGGDWQQRGDHRYHQYGGGDDDDRRRRRDERHYPQRGRDWDRDDKMKRQRR